MKLFIVGLIEDNAVRVELPLHAEATALAHLASVGDLPLRIATDFSRTLSGI